MNRNNRQYNPMPVDFGDVRGHVELPRSLCPANAPPEVMIRSVWTSFNDFSNESFTPLIPVGGTVVFDLYKFGELFPMECKGWTVRQVYEIDKTLASIPYPDPKCNSFFYYAYEINSTTKKSYSFVDRTDSTTTASTN